MRYQCVHVQHSTDPSLAMNAAYVGHGLTHCGAMIFARQNRKASFIRCRGGPDARAERCVRQNHGPIRVKSRVFEELCLASTGAAPYTLDG